MSMADSLRYAETQAASKAAAERARAAAASEAQAVNVLRRTLAPQHQRSAIPDGVTPDASPRAGLPGGKVQHRWGSPDPEYLPRETFAEFSRARVRERNCCATPARSPSEFEHSSYADLIEETAQASLAFTKNREAWDRLYLWLRVRASPVEAISLRRRVWSRRIVLVREMKMRLANSIEAA